MDFTKPDREQQRFWEQTSYLYQSQMTEECLTYLRGRGLSTETILFFRLGYVETPVKGHEYFRGRVCIPYLKKRATVALKFRCIQDHDCKDFGHAKYLTEGEQWLYNTNALDTDLNYACQVEGEFGAMINHQIKLPTVGIPGVKSWKGHPHWAEVFKPFDRVYNFADNDSSKKENYGHNLAKEIKRDLPRMVLVELPADEDSDSTYLKYGARELYERCGLPWMDSNESSHHSSQVLLVA